MKRSAVLFCLFATVLAGCGSFSAKSLSSITITADQLANENNALAIDLVMITDKDAAGAIQKLTAREWFQRKRQFIRDYPDGFKTLSWELTPGQVLREQRIASPPGMADAIIFASYRGEGDHRLRLGDIEKARIVLDETEMRQQP